jgi:integrase/recombinase XerD
VLYGTGARISEAVGLDIDDLDLETGSVLLRGKGSKQRVVPVGSYAIDAVNAVPRTWADRARVALDPGGVLNARGGRPVATERWPCWCGTAERAGVPRTSRRTRCGTRSRRICSTAVPTYAWSRSCWARVVTTTQVYTLVTVDKLREVYATAHPRARG